MFGVSLFTIAKIVAVIALVVVVKLVLTAAYHHLVENSAEFKALQKSAAADHADLVIARGQLDAQRVYAKSVEDNWIRAQQKSAALAATIKEQANENERLRKQRVAALPPAVANLPFPAAAVDVLDDAAAGRATADAGGQAQANAARLAAPDTGAARAGSTVGLVTGWCATAVDAFNACRKEVKGWNDYFDSLWEGVPNGP